MVLGLVVIARLLALTAAFLVAVVDAVVGAVTAGPLRDAAVVCQAGELRVLVTLVLWPHCKDRERGIKHEKEGCEKNKQTL